MQWRFIRNRHPYLSFYSSLAPYRNIVPYLKKYGTNPATGEKLEAKSLIKLNFFKNANGIKTQLDTHHGEEEEEDDEPDNTV